jgi:carbohydrate-selective porin OprB
VAYNARGGIKSEVANADQYLAGVTLDLDRLFGLHESLFQISITERTGRNLSDDAELGTLRQVQEIFGRGQTVRLTQSFFDQKYFNDLVDWKVGRAPFGGDFATFDCDFQNLTFCGTAPGNPVGNYIWNWPISQWMTRLKFNLTGFGYFQFAIVDDNPKYLRTQDQVLPVFFPGSTGALIPVELGWLPTFGGGKLPGSYKIGAWYDTSNAPNVVDVLGTVAATNRDRAARVFSSGFGWARRRSSNGSSRRLGLGWRPCATPLRRCGSCLRVTRGSCLPSAGQSVYGFTTFSTFDPAAVARLGGSFFGSAMSPAPTRNRARMFNLTSGDAFVRGGRTSSSVDRAAREFSNQVLTKPRRTPAPHGI